MSKVQQIFSCHVFEIKNGLTPDKMCEHFIPESNNHTHKTRCSIDWSYTILKVKKIWFENT